MKNGGQHGSNVQTGIEKTSNGDVLRGELGVKSLVEVTMEKLMMSGK